MKISGIYTIRDVPRPSYWDIVFEWEDQIAETLNIPLICVGRRFDKIYRPSFIRKILNRLNVFQVIDRYLSVPSRFHLAFHIGPPGVYSFYTRNNVVPVIIDFWKNENINRLESIFRICPIVFVTSREVFNFLQNRISKKVRWGHLPLSLPDKYCALDTGVRRDIDIIQVGRSNTTLDTYMDIYLKEFPNTNYVYAKKAGNEVLMVSSKDGDLGSIRNRSDFIMLLRRSKVSLVSSPGLDNDKLRTGGFSPVTPRFLESAACRCHLLGIYPDNADFEFYEINQICQTINDYNHFKKLIGMCLYSQPTPDFTTFLQKHLTSKRALELQNILDE